MGISAGDLGAAYKLSVAAHLIRSGLMLRGGIRRGYGAEEDALARLNEQWDFRFHDGAGFSPRHGQLTTELAHAFTHSTDAHTHLA